METLHFPHILHGERQSFLITENGFVFGTVIHEGAPDVLHQ